MPLDKNAAHAERQSIYRNEFYKAVRLAVRKELTGPREVQISDATLRELANEAVNDAFE